jgi:transposase
MYIFIMDLANIQSIDDLPRDINILLPAFWAIVLENRKLTSDVKLLRKELFGSKSEKRIISDDAQTVMQELLDQITPVIDITKDQYVEVKASRRRKKHPGRNAIPDSIETVTHICDISEEQKTAAKESGAPLTKIGEQQRVVIERQPAKYTKHVYIQYVYASKTKDTITTADAPLVTPIPRILAGLNLLVFVILSKYQYHLPLYRIQRQIFHESRIWFTRATMVGWIAEICVPLRRIYAEMILSIKVGDCIFSDDTRIKCVAHTSCMWVYVDGTMSTAVFDYRDTKGAVAPREFLKGVAPHTYLMTDGNASYNEAVQRYTLTQMACMMHVRREFVEAMEAGSHKDYAMRILIYIGQLYRIERYATKKELTFAQRHELRQQYSKAVLDKIKALLVDPQFILLPQSLIGKAIQYALNHWGKVMRFLDRGDLPIDNGVSERVIRDLAVGRNNWLFVQSDNGGERMAILYSIIQTCKLNSINPEEYLKDILMRIAVRPQDASVCDLTPMEWLKAKNGGILPKKQALYPSKN